MFGWPFPLLEEQHVPEAMPNQSWTWTTHFKVHQQCDGVCCWVRSKKAMTRITFGGWHIPPTHAVLGDVDISTLVDEFPHVAQLVMGG
jgi:hypothetical protein